MSPRIGYAIMTIGFSVGAAVFLIYAAWRHMTRTADSERFSWRLILSRRRSFRETSVPQLLIEAALLMAFAFMSAWLFLGVV